MQHASSSTIMAVLLRSIRIIIGKYITTLKIIRCHKKVKHISLDRKFLTRCYLNTLHISTLNWVSATLISLRIITFNCYGPLISKEVWRKGKVTLQGSWINMLHCLRSYSILLHRWYTWRSPQSEGLLCMCSGATSFQLASIKLSSAWLIGR